MHDDQINTVKEFEEALRTHRPYLVKNINVMDLLINPFSFNHIISEDDQGSIRNCYDTNKVEQAAEMLIDALLRSQEETKWSVFKDVLDRSDNLRLVKDILYKGETVSLIDHDNDQTKLRLQRGRFVDSFDAQVVSNQLLQEELLSRQEYEEVMATFEHRGNSAATFDILVMVSRRKHFYPKLLNILWELASHSLVRELDPLYADKLEVKSQVGNNSSKVTDDYDDDKAENGANEVCGNNIGIGLQTKELKVKSQTEEIEESDDENTENGAKGFCGNYRRRGIGFHIPKLKAQREDKAYSTKYMEDSEDDNTEKGTKACYYELTSGEIGFHTIDFNSSPVHDDYAALPFTGDRTGEIRKPTAIEVLNIVTANNLNCLDDGPIASRTRSKTNFFKELITYGVSEAAVERSPYMGLPSKSDDTSQHQTDMKPVNPDRHTNTEQLHVQERRTTFSDILAKTLKLPHPTHDSQNPLRPHSRGLLNKASHAASSFDTDNRDVEKIKVIPLLQDVNLRVCGCGKRFAREDDLIEHQNKRCTLTMAVNRVSSGTLNPSPHERITDQPVTVRQTELFSGMQDIMTNLKLCACGKRFVSERYLKNHKMNDCKLHQSGTRLKEILPGHENSHLPADTRPTHPGLSLHNSNIKSRLSINQKQTDTVHSHEQDALQTERMLQRNKIYSVKKVDDLEKTRMERHHIIPEMHGDLTSGKREERISFNEQDVLHNLKYCVCGKRFVSSDELTRHQKNSCTTFTASRHQKCTAPKSDVQKHSTALVTPSVKPPLSETVKSRTSYQCDNSDRVCCCGAIFSSYEHMIIHRTRKGCAKKQYQSRDVLSYSLPETVVKEERQTEFMRESGTSYPRKGDMKLDRTDRGHHLSTPNFERTKEVQSAQFNERTLNAKTSEGVSNCARAQTSENKYRSDQELTDKDTEYNRKVQHVEPATERSSGFGFQSSSTLKFMKPSPT